MRSRFHKLIPLWLLPVMMITVGPAVPTSHGQTTDIDTVTPQVHLPSSYWLEQLPPGKDRQLVIDRCAYCHDFQRAIAFSRPKAQWEEVVGSMIKRGSPVTPEEFPRVVDYFTEHFGPNSKPGNLTGMQPCKESEWPKGSKDFRKPWGNSGYTIWASDQQGGTVDIINPETTKVVRRIRCMSAPDRVEFSPDGNTAYIPDRVEWNLTVVDTRTGAIQKKIPVIARPNTAVLTRDGKELIMAIWPVRPDEGTKGYLEIIDAVALKKVKTIEMRAGIHDTWMAKGGEMFLAMSGAAAFVDDANKFMDAFDTQTKKVLWTCCTKGSIGTMEMEKGPDGKTSRVFVALERYPGIVVFDGKTGAELERVPFPTDFSGPFANVAPRSFHGQEISPDGKSMWLMSQNIVYQMSLPELKHIGHIHLAQVDQLGKPFKPATEGTWLTISPDGKTVYCARPGRNLISVVDVASMKETGQIPVGEYPLHIAIWPRGTP